MKMNVQEEEKTLLGKESTEQVRRTNYHHTTFKLCCLPLILILIAVICGITFFFYRPDNHGNSSHICTDTCVITLVETIPENLTYEQHDPMHLSTGRGLIELISNAKKSISIASFYWTLRGIDLPYHDSSSKQGEELLNTLINAGKYRNISIKIVQNLPSKMYPDTDTELLRTQGHAEVRSINFRKLVGAGILHSKMWLIDEKHFYVGSANLDWRSLTQIKELGVIIRNCSCLTQDMQKIFDVYWMLALPDAVIPKTWPMKLYTDINKYSPETVTYNETTADIYLSSSPKEFCPPGRTEDISSILSVIYAAKQFIYIAVMDYSPTTLYSRPRKYWHVIDDALREAAFNRGVKVYLLASNWTHSHSDMFNFLHSLQDIRSKYVNIQVKLFNVPIYTESQQKIPFARVNHNKYMVTDTHAYIGTSNWSGDYFINTGGIGFILKPTGNNTDNDIRRQLENIFIRDWYSNYSLPLSNSKTILS